MSNDGLTTSFKYRDEEQKKALGMQLVAMDSDVRPVIRELLDEFIEDRDLRLRIAKRLGKIANSEKPKAKTLTKGGRGR